MTTGARVVGLGAAHGDINFYIANRPSTTKFPAY